MVRCPRSALLPRHRRLAAASSGFASAGLPVSFRSASDAHPASRAVGLEIPGTTHEGVTSGGEQTIDEQARLTAWPMQLIRRR